MAGSLQDELLAIPGIAGAEFEGSEEHPAGVRVQLAVGADAELVGREVQRVLASHGMRSQMADEEPPSGSVVNLSDYEAEQLAVAEAAEVAPGDEAETETEAEVEVMSGPPPAVQVPSVEVDATEPEAPVALPPVAAPTVAGIAVDEDGQRVTITVRATTGATASRTVPATPHGMDEGAAFAAAELVAAGEPWRLVAITDATIDGSPVVTVVFEVAGGRKVAGSAVIHGSRSYAVARATRAALVS